MTVYEKALNELKEQGIVPASDTVLTKSSDELIIEEMSRILHIEYSDEQKQCMLHRGNMAILACAGSGKTTLLINILAKRIWNREIMDTSRVVCTTYSRGGTDEINDRLNKLLTKLGIRCSINIRTMHSFFYSLIKTFGMGHLKVISSGLRLSYIKESCKDAGFKCKDDDLVNIDSLLSYRCNNLLSDSEAIASTACNIDDLSISQFEKIRKGYDLRKFQNGYIDFDDMQLYLYKWLCIDVNSDNEDTRKIGQDVRNYCRAMYDSFYIDEAQDISKIQYKIVKAIITNPDTNLVDKGIVFMGDDDQCIYKWRGASPEIILTVGTSLNMKNFILSTNYRCKSEIVDFAHRSVRYNSVRFQKSMAAYSSGGDINITQCNSNNLYEISKVALEVIEDKIKKGTRKKDIAVLCRNNVHLSILNNMLIERGIYCSIPDEMKLTKNYMFKDIKDMMYLNAASYDCNIFRNILWKICSGMSFKIAGSIAQFQSDNGLTIEQTIDYVINNIIGNGKKESKLIISGKSHERLKYSLTSISSASIEALEELHEIITSTDAEEKIYNDICKMYIVNTEYLYRNTDKSRCIKGMIDYISDMVNRKGMKEAKNYIRVTEQLEASNFQMTSDTVVMMTVHGSKGKEWEHVILFACDNEAMPGQSNIQKLIDRGNSAKDIFDLIDEERRLYYVGCTRAKETLTIISDNHPSTFILESLEYFKEVESTTNGNIIFEMKEKLNSIKLENKCGSCNIVIN